MLASCTMMATVLPTPSVKCVPLSGAGLSPDSSQEWPRSKPQETSFHIFNETWFKVFSTKTKEGHLCLHQNKLSSEKQPARDRGCGSPHFFAQEQPLASRVTLRGTWVSRPLSPTCYRCGPEGGAPVDWRSPALTGPPPTTWPF